MARQAPSLTGPMPSLLKIGDHDAGAFLKGDDSPDTACRMPGPLAQMVVIKNLSRHVCKFACKGGEDS